jgi:hypothetical protein
MFAFPVSSTLLQVHRLVAKFTRRGLYHDEPGFCQAIRWQPSHVGISEGTARILPARKLQYR